MATIAQASGRKARARDSPAERRRRLAAETRYWQTQRQMRLSELRGIEAKLAALDLALAATSAEGGG